MIGRRRFIRYENQMPRGSAQKASASLGREGWLMVVASASLGSIIAGAFTVLHDWSSSDKQRCALATQFLGDETPSPALNASNRQRLAAQAQSRLLRCLGDS
jgi:hypothetical protein